MRRKSISIFLLLLLFFLSGCDPFVRPHGTWVCEELNITLDFTYDGREAATGTILLDGEIRDVVCLLSSGGTTSITYPSADGRYSAEQDYLYDGYFKHKNKNKMILILTTAGKGGAKKTGEEYIFIKLEDTEATTKTDN